jgi:hypothetical protein
MNKKLITFFILLFVIVCNCQIVQGQSQLITSPDNIINNKIFGSAGGDFDKIINSDDGYVVGTTAFFNNELMTCDSALGIWILKLNNNLEIVWQTCLQGGFKDIVEDVNGNIYIVASTNIYSNPSTSINTTDILIYRLDSNGNEIWQNRFGQAGADVPEGICIVNENIYIMGTTSSSDGYFTVNHGGFDYFLVSIDTNGSFLSANCYGGTSNEYGVGIVYRESNNDFLLYGNKNSSLEYNVLSIDLNFNVLNEYIFGDPINHISSVLSKLLIDADDNSIYLCGLSTGNIDNMNSGGYSATSDYWVVKLDQNLNYLWNKYYGFSGTDQLHDALFLNDGSICLIGITSGSACENPCDVLVPNQTNGNILSTYGAYDGLALVVNNNGELNEIKNFGGSGFEWFSSIAVSNNNEFIILGTSSSNDYDLDYVNADNQSNLWVLEFNSVSDCLSDSVFINQSICENNNLQGFEWNGNNYTQSGVYTWTGSNLAGCDSVVTLSLTINQQPVQPELECYQTASFSAQTCSWDVTGTQPAQPATACYQTATFNTQTCSWIVTGTQPTQPQTACYQTAIFNNQTCNWELMGSPNPAAITTASACNTYLWNVNGQSYTSSNTYIYFANCQDYQLNLTINPTPSVTFEPDNTTYCNNSGSVDLSGGSPEGGVYSGTGVINGTFDPILTGSGVHLVTYTYANVFGCSNSSSVDFEVSVCTGVEAVVQPELEVRPNPMESSTWVSLKNYTGNDAEFNLLLLDATGREVFRKSVFADAIREGYHLQISELASGTYVLMLNNSKYNGVTRLVK